MIWNLWKKIRQLKERSSSRLVLVERDRQERVKAMLAEQTSIQLELGFDIDDSVHGWLRLHQILKDHEDRIKKLEDSVK
jgi:hypothetical protein